MEFKEKKNDLGVNNRKTSNTGKRVGVTGREGAWDPVCCQLQSEQFSLVSILP
jgi:hypothetical protein